MQRRIISSNPLSLWERACSRIRCVIQHLCWLIHRFREQARSHKVFRSIQNQYLTIQLDDKHYHSLEMDQVFP
ncbi:hypothetical protein C0J26_20745 [Pseudomonas baetica]|nr:hypothetical protein C0J26_20745 [Pseudomonas baetica]